MPLFGKGGGGTQPSAAFVVGAVTQPSRARKAGEVLISGVVLAPGRGQLRQLTAVLPPNASPPAVGAEFPATLHSSGSLASVTLTHALVGGTTSATPTVGGPGQWDSGPGGVNDMAFAPWLAAQGFQSPDFGGSLSPGLAALLDQYAVQYAPIIDPQTDSWLLASGERVRGEVTAVSDLPLRTRTMGNPQMSVAWMTFLVTPPQGPAYQATLRMGFSTAQRRVELATIGSQQPLRRDSGNPTLITIDRIPVFH